MPTFFFLKSDFVWHGEAENSDDAFRLCLSEMGWQMDDSVKYIGVNISNEEFLKYRYHVTFSSPCDPPIEGFAYGFADKNGIFYTPKQMREKFGLNPEEDLPNYSLF